MQFTIFLNQTNLLIQIEMLKFGIIQKLAVITDEIFKLQVTSFKFQVLIEYLAHKHMSTSHINKLIL